MKCLQTNNTTFWLNDTKTHLERVGSKDTTIVIPNGVKTLVQFAIEAQNTVQEIVLPKTCTEMSVYAILNMPNLRVVTAENPKILKFIKENFYNCPKLEQINIGMRPEPRVPAKPMGTPGLTAVTLTQVQTIDRKKIDCFISKFTPTR